MNEDSPSGFANSDLRKRAEASLRQQKIESPKTRNENEQELHHELQVHQVELELQNSELQRIQTETENAREKLANLYDLAPVAYLTLDCKSIILDVNLTACNMFVSTRESMLGKSCTEFIYAEDQDSFYFHMQAIFKSSPGTVFSCALRMKKDTNAIFPVLLETTLVTPAKDTTAQAYMIVQDRSVQVKEEQTLEHLFNTTHLLIAYLDPGFNFIRVNKTYAAADNHDPSFFPGKNHFTLYPNEENEAIFRRVVETGKPFTTSAKPFVYAEHPERGTSYWDWTLEPVKDESGKVEGLLFTLRDVTSNVIAEKKMLDKQNTDLLDGENRILHESLVSKTEHGLATKFLQVARDLTRNTIGLVGKVEGGQILNNILAFDNGSGANQLWSPEKFALYLDNSGILSNILKHGNAQVYNTRLSPVEGIEMSLAYQEIENILAVPLRTKGTITGIIALGNKNGGFNIRDQGTIDHLTLIFDQALQRKRVEDEIQSIANLPAENPNLIFRISTDNTVLYANGAGRSLLDKAHIPIGGKIPVAWIPLEGQQGLNGIPHKVIVDINASIFVMEIVPIKTMGYVNIYGRDITDLKRAQDTLVQNAKELQLKTEALESSNRELEVFAFAASHDLQEPLRMINMHVQLLAQQSRGCLNDGATKSLETVSESSNRMSNMIRDLLDYSRIYSHAIPFGPVDLNVVIKDSLSNLTAAINDSRATIQCDTLPIVTGDAIQLAQVFQNLLSNAIKYNKDAEPCKITVGTFPNSPDREEWHLYIQDNGIGIDPRYFPKLFTMFQRLHTRTAYPGTGVGLAACKKIIERHGGRIWVESEPGKGSTFHFTIPKIIGQKT